MLIKSHKKCEQCGQSFAGHNSRRRFENHMKTHIKSQVEKIEKVKKKEFPCELCKKIFRREWNLNRHKETCFENLDCSISRIPNIVDPLSIMPKPEKELDWSWRDKMKREKMEKIVKVKVEIMN